MSGAPGGDGGDGGDAWAQALVEGGTQALADAKGGDVGYGGGGGATSLPPRQYAQPGRPGEQGGNAAADASAEIHYADLPGGAKLDVHAVATGGESILTTPARRGGDATATARGVVENGDLAGAVGSSHSIEAHARAGIAAGDGRSGDALADAEGRTDGGSLEVSSRAAAGPTDAGAAGVSDELWSVASHARAIHTGSGTVRAVAELFAGTSPVPIRFSVSASSIATGDASAHALARVASQTEIEVRDAVSGSSATELVLEQDVSISPYSNADVVSSLEASNPGGGNLIARIDARGGSGTLGALGGGARIDSIHATGARDVTVEGRARAGSNSTPTRMPGGRAEIGSLFGRSTGGGAVVVEADAETLFDNASDVVLDRVVNGETTGALTLVQRAKANGGGDATSHIVTAASSQNVDVVSQAFGLRADATADVVNDAGGVKLAVDARGGARRDGESGPEASSFARAVTRGDGHAIEIGGQLFIGARGGTGSSGKLPTELIWQGGNGGRALSRSAGIAEGDSAVFVSEWAIGGSGGGYGGQSAPGAQIDGGRGGDAEASAFGSNAGDSPVSVDSTAIGGAGGWAIGPSPRTGGGGHARAEARAESSGAARVGATANAFGGFGGLLTIPGSDDGHSYDSSTHGPDAVVSVGRAGDSTALAVANGHGEVRAVARAGADWDWVARGLLDSSQGDASARAEAIGDSGSAIANATVAYGIDSRLRARVEREVFSTATVEASASQGRLDPDPATDASGRASWIAAPSGLDERGTLDAHPEWALQLDDRPDRRIGALAEWSARAGADPETHQRVELGLMLVGKDAEGPVALAVSTSSVLSGGFESLVFQLLVDDEVMETHRFEGVSAADSFFSTLVSIPTAWLEPPGIDGSSPIVTAAFDVTLSLAQSVAFDVALVVPEPSSAVLIGIGLALIGLRSRSDGVRSSRGRRVVVHPSTREGRRS